MRPVDPIEQGAHLWQSLLRLLLDVVQMRGDDLDPLAGDGDRHDQIGAIEAESPVVGHRPVLDRDDRIAAENSVPPQRIGGRSPGGLHPEPL